MCGIAGVLGIETEETALTAMLQTMSRRGPDECGIFQDPNIQLIHARLTVIDPEQGKQPMTFDYQGGKYTLIYNGELYNTQELRQALAQLGHTFNGHSDTEVVLHSYAQWKENCVDHFNGIFAFAVWDAEARILFLARDRIGVKPLFYTEYDSGLIFASEIKTILRHPSVTPTLDAQGAAQLILLGPGRLPGSGVFHGIRELEPGCTATYRQGKLNISNYWKLTDREHTEDFETTADHVRWLLTDAIRRQMVSDVPIGTFLSGGLDSSIITAVCAEEMRSRGEQLKTFSVDYEDNEKYYVSSKFQPESDNQYIQFMQSAAQTEHNWTMLSPQTLYEALQDAVRARDLPGMADVDASLLAFCGRIRRHVTVALSGECADEIFGGYPWYRDPQVRDRDGFPWAQNTALRAAVLNPQLRDLIPAEEFVMDAYRDTCRRSDILPGTNPEDRRTKEMVNLNFRWFMQTLLDRKDRMSMYQSLEVRVPFCDYRIAEYLYGVPWQYKDYQGREKGLLRYAVRGLLPEQILYRKKSPYPKTFDPGYENLVFNRLKQIMDTDSPLFSLVDKSRISGLIEQENPWPWYGQLMKRPQVMAYLLQLDFWLREYRVQLLF